MNQTASSPLPLADTVGQCVHDVRNALAAISSASEVLTRVDPPDELIREAGVVVQRQTRNLSRRLTELLDLVQRVDEPGRALAVSDDARLLAVLGGMLAACGYKVEFCAGTEEGLRALQRRPYAIAVVDVRTSHGAGLGLGQRARSAGFDGRMVAVWGSQLPHQHTHEEGVARFDAVLPRHFEPPALRAALGQG